MLKPTQREIPSNLVLKKVTPRIWIGFMAFMWGLICMCIGFVHNYTQFVTLRAMLGLAEGGMFPGLVGSKFLLHRHSQTSRCVLLTLLCYSKILYLSTVYTRSELALRIGVLYTATSLSSAFGGM